MVWMASIVGLEMQLCSLFPPYALLVGDSREVSE
jgi:hypothetical protein